MTTDTGAERDDTRRWLIVNSDDFGASDGVNAGVIAAFDDGIVTSSSLMVTMPAAEAAAGLAKQRPGMSVGIHVDLTGEGTRAPADIADVAACELEIDAQLERFRELMGRDPSHVDAHHNIYRLPHLEPLFIAAAERLGRPLREHGEVRYFGGFYGQWDDGESHPDWISPANLIRMLDEDIGSGVTELSCHPGLVDPALDSPYHADRETELATLCDSSVKAHLGTSDLVVINYDDLRATRSNS